MGGGVLQQAPPEKVGILSGKVSEFVMKHSTEKTLKATSTPRHAPRVAPLSTGT